VHKPQEYPPAGTSKRPSSQIQISKKKERSLRILESQTRYEGKREDGSKELQKRKEEGGVCWGVEHQGFLYKKVEGVVALAIGEYNILTVNSLFIVDFFLSYV
jgi:hypothetical protein